MSIEAMKQALEAFEFYMDLPSDCCPGPPKSAYAALRTAIEQAEKQEPVAWGMPREDGFIFDVICPEEHARLEGGYTIPLYTHPPKQWVGLTDEEWVKELGKVREQVNGDVFGGFYCAIEAKLKQKNGYAEEKNT